MNEAQIEAIKQILKKNKFLILGFSTALIGLIVIALLNNKLIKPEDTEKVKKVLSEELQNATK